MSDADEDKDRQARKERADAIRRIRDERAGVPSAPEHTTPSMKPLKQRASAEDIAEEQDAEPDVGAPSKSPEPNENKPG